MAPSAFRRSEVQDEGMKTSSSTATDFPVARVATVRSYLGPNGQAFVVKVYAAVVTSVGKLDLAPNCTVLRPDEILRYLAA
jgi:hypothetical protein